MVLYLPFLRLMRDAFGSWSRIYSLSEIFHGFIQSINIHLKDNNSLQVTSLCHDINSFWIAYRGILGVFNVCWLVHISVPVAVLLFTGERLSVYDVLRTALFWVVTQRVVVISYRRFGTISIPSSGFKVDSWTLRMGPIGCPETLIRNYHYSLCNNLEKPSSQLLRGGSLKSLIWRVTVTNLLT